MAAGSDPEIYSLVATPPDTALHWLALGGHPSAGTAHSGEDLARLLGSARDRWNLYLGVNPCGSSSRSRPTAREILFSSTLFLDIDTTSGGETPRPLQAAERLIDLASDLLGTRIDPHLIDSGRGAQLWVPLVPTPFRDHADRIRWQLGTSVLLRILAARLQGRSVAVWIPPLPTSPASADSRLDQPQNRPTRFAPITFSTSTRPLLSNLFLRLESRRPRRASNPLYNMAKCTTAAQRNVP
jgi:hypothetical protein